LNLKKFSHHFEKLVAFRFIEGINNQKLPHDCDVHLLQNILARLEEEENKLKTFVHFLLEGKFVDLVNDFSVEHDSRGIARVLRSLRNLHKQRLLGLLSGRRSERMLKLGLKFPFVSWLLVAGDVGHGERSRSLLGPALH